MPTSSFPEHAPALTTLAPFSYMEYMATIKGGCYTALMHCHAILFDADGVLIRSKHLFSERLQKEYGIDMQKMLPFFTGVFKECTIGRADLKEELAKVLPDWGWPGTVATLLDFWFTKGTEIDEDMAAVVRSIRGNGIATYLVSDQERYRGEHLRATLEGTLFQHVFFSAEMGCIKKQAQFWEQVYAFVRADVQQRQGAALQKDACLYVDDGADNLAVAQAFGFTPFHYTGNMQELRAAAM